MENSIDKIAEKYIDKKAELKYELDAHHPFSSVALDTEATIENWNSKQLKILTNRKISNYAMLNISSPSIGSIFPQGIWSKVSQSKNNNNLDLIDYLIRQTSYFLRQQLAK